MENRFEVGKRREVRERAQRPSPFLYLSTVYAFDSLPIDIMHILYCNVAPNFFNILLSSDSDLSNLAHLSGSDAYSAGDATLLRSRSGIAEGLSGYPWGLDCISTWNATEWKHFVTGTSLVALHEWVTSDVLD